MSKPIDQKEIEAAIANMRELAINPAKRDAMQSAWDNALSALERHYLAMRPKPKSFEVHHMNETARARFACAIAAGRSWQDCTAVAIEAVIHS